MSFAVNLHLSPTLKSLINLIVNSQKQRAPFVMLLVLSVFLATGASHVPGGSFSTAPVLMGFKEKQSKHAVTASLSLSVYQHREH